MTNRTMPGKTAHGAIRSAILLFLAVAGLVPAPRAEETPKTATFPFFTLCMDTHDSQKRTLEQQAALLKELGYDGAGHLWLDQVSERIATLDAAGLKLFQIYMSITVAPGATPYDERLTDVLPLLKDRNVTIATLMDGLPPSDTAGDARAVAVLREIADKAQPYGVRVALYPHSNAWLERVEDAIRVADQVDRLNVGVMFNLCHWLKVDDEANLEPLLTKAMPRLFTVTVNGADHADAIHAGTGNWIQPLDSGTFDLRNLLVLLRKLGYIGPVGLQCYGLTGDAREHLTRSITAWRALNEPR